MEKKSIPNSCFDKMRSIFEQVIGGNLVALHLGFNLEITKKANEICEDKKKTPWLVCFFK